MGENQSEVLLERAREDEHAARSMLGLRDIADSIIGFHCQQAVEKSLKAVLLAREIKAPRTHDLEGLQRLCRSNGIEVPDRLDGVGRLSPYAVEHRYWLARGTSLDRELAVGWAGVAVDWAAERARDREREERWRSRSSPQDRADR